MRKILAVLVALGILGGVSWLTLSLAIATTSGGCPTALLQGTLVEVDGTLGVESVPPGSVTIVSWPFGYGVGREDGSLVLTRLFATVAREGDRVSAGGGMAPDNVTFAACGPVTLGLLAPPEAITPRAQDVRAVTRRRSTRSSRRGPSTRR